MISVTPTHVFLKTPSFFFFPSNGGPNHSGAFTVRSSSSSSLQEIDKSSKPWEGKELSSELYASAPFPAIKSAKRVVLVRHGQSTWNEEGRIQGSSDFSVLTKKGESQAETSRQMLIDDSFDVCFTSPLIRSKRTAEIIWGNRNDGMISESDLREIDLYSFQGLLKHEGKAKFGAAFRQWQVDAANFNIDGHYPVRELWNRARTCWTKILEHESRSVLVVAHNAVNQALVATAIGLGTEYFRVLLQSNCGVSVLDFTPRIEGGSPFICLNRLNQTPSSPIAGGTSGGRKSSKRIILVCHGLTQTNTEAGFPFAGDQTMNMLGVIRSQKTAELLLDLKVSSIVSSPKNACIETAMAISRVQEAADCLGADCVPRYVETKQTENLDPNTAEASYLQPGWLIGFEDRVMSAVWDQSGKAWQYLLNELANEEEREKVVVAVGDPAIHMALMGHCLNLTKEWLGSFHLDAGSISVIDFPDGPTRRGIIRIEVNFPFMVLGYEGFKVLGFRVLVDEVIRLVRKLFVNCELLSLTKSTKSSPEEVEEVVSDEVEEVDDVVSNEVDEVDVNIDLKWNLRSVGVVHHLLRRQVHTYDNMKYLEFNFGGNKVQFRKKEFGIITGLKMGPVPANNPASSYDRIRDDYFNGSDVITNAMVKDVYTNTTQWMEDDHMVKLSLLCILECGLLGKESHFEIKLDHVSMVDDLPTFNAYPWGELAWEATINSLQKALEKPNSSGTYSLGGCPIAFQYDMVAILEANLGEENMLTVSEHGHDEHHDDAGYDIVEPPLKRAHTDIHEGVDALHSIPQQSPHQNVQQFEAPSSRQSKLMNIKEKLKCILTLTLMDKKSFHKGEDTQKYIIPLSTQDEDEVIKIVRTEEEVINNEDVNRKESVNKMEDMHTAVSADTVNKMEDTHTADTVNKMEGTHTVHIEEETHIVHMEEETHTVHTEEETVHTEDETHIVHMEEDTHTVHMEQTGQQESIITKLTDNTVVFEAKDGEAKDDELDIGMKPAAEGVIQSFVAYLLKDPPEVISLGEYEPITLEFLQVRTKTTAAWLTDEPKYVEEWTKFKKFKGKRKNKKVEEPIEWNIDEFLMGYAWRTAYPEALNVVQANKINCASSVVRLRLRLRFMSQTKLDEVGRSILSTSSELMS
ncbi:hypothetical protein FNV43_RR05798 [Rhamnella rubrinervis]|uniref:2-carboxy-D-arabinitol-1-phosphatase n=1 Tax=Rhamnella rubrinervis TaxID=2594499 RepID=A0A8K0HNA8_9ROSA|nr:hypothetical protein FNV43_RR05798 [Rhamnella rubrinervis]